MSVTLTGYRLRCEVQTTDFGLPFVAVSGSRLRVPAGADLRFEFLFKVGDEIVSVANFATCLLGVYAADRTGGAYFTDTVSSFDNTADQTSWDAATKQHCAFDFLAAVTNLPATISGTEYYLLLVVKDSGGLILTEAWTRFVVILDNYPTTEAVVQPGNIVPGGATYDGSGDYTLATAVVGVYYKWTDGGANDTGFTTGGGSTITTNNINFVAAAPVVLKGTIGAAVTAVVRPSPYLTADEVAALIAGQPYGTSYGGVGEPEGVVSAKQWCNYQQVDGDDNLVRSWVRVVGAGTINTGWR